MTRATRAVTRSVVCLLALLTVASLAGCGAGHALLGIHAAPPPKTAAAPLTVDQTRTIITRDFTAAYQGMKPTGASAAAARSTAYAGEALRAVHARVKLARVQPTVTDSPLLSPDQPQVLAVSRGFGFPRFIVAQSVGLAGALPVLHLLTSPDASTPYRISLSAEMLPLAKVKPFDPLNQGSPLVRDGTGLAAAPAALLHRYAAWLAYPAMTRQPAGRLSFSADVFSAQVRARAAAVAKAVATQATFSQVHTVVPGSVYAIRQGGGDVLVFGVLERKDTFAVKAGQAVNTAANKAFVLLTGRRKVAKAATITTLEFVVFEMPRSAARATLVAAREQVVAGSGS